MVAPTPPPERADRPLGELLGQLMSDLAQLVQKEIQLAKAEASEKFSQVTGGAASLAIGGLVAFAGLLALLDAAIYGLADLLGDDAPLWLSALIVGLIVGGIGMVLLLRGRSHLKPENLSPRRTTESLRQDVELIKDHVR